jgi:hypothetical protein
MNQPSTTIFRFQEGPLWHRSLSRRSQNGRVLGTACDVLSLAGCLCLLYVIPILCGAWALPPKSLLQNRCFSAPLTALHATGRSVVDVAEKNMEGRHVGLKFYDLLIEV